MPYTYIYTRVRSVGRVKIIITTIMLLRYDRDDARDVNTIIIYCLLWDRRVVVVAVVGTGAACVSSGRAVR